MTKQYFIGLLLAFTILLSGCASTRHKAPSKSQRHHGNSSNSSYSVRGKSYKILSSSKHYQERGIASWYGRKFHHRRTSSGERYNMYKMTAAHKTLPLHSYVKVTNLANGHHVIVKINDRGPFAKGRIIDVSYAAAKQLGMIGHGTAHVEIKSTG